MADPVVQNCGPTDFVDVRTAAATERQLDWDFSITTNPKRCLLIQTGQAVTWQTTPGSDLSVHPLTTQGGDTPNPIGFHEEGLAATVTFNAVGTFGYKCQAHSSMIGAVKVVQATVTPPPAGGAAPAVPVPLVVGLALGLLISGRALLRQRLARSQSANP